MAIESIDDVSPEMIVAGAKVIAEDSDACSGATVPCVPDVGDDECSCMRTARAVIVAMIVAQRDG